jgi:polyhydroxyalkanoate synthase subunit PhaC
VGLAQGDRKAMTAARARPAPGPPRRPGPRPLPVHLLAAGVTWHSSRLALPLLKNGLLPWKPDLALHAAALARDLGETTFPDFAAAVETELLRRADALAAGIEAYRSHPYRRTLSDPPVIWQEGTTRLCDYSPSGGVPVLVVPSLINRATILDLDEERSLLRHLAATGLRPLLVDWDRPGEAERQFDLTAYVAGRLEQAFEAAITAAGAPMAVLGYCMGGLLALGLALRRQRDVARLALLATPWDFQSDNPELARFIAALAEPVTAGFGLLGEVPTDILQTLFFLADPHLVSRKFLRFAELDPASPEARNFVATEDWLNDGVPLALPVARECFAGWYGGNTALTGRWRLAGLPVDPGRFQKPAMVVVPARDKLVPPVSALALAQRLPQVEVLQPDLGHIGLVIGSKAPEAVWTPLGDWLRRG